MADTEDWRRQRAEALRLHDAAPWPARPARDHQPTADGIEPMRPPVTPERPLVAPTNAPPARDDASRGDRDRRYGAEPVSRRYRQEAPLARSPAAVSVADTPIETRRAIASRAPRMSLVARRPLVFGAAIGGALTAAGALGWLLRAEIEPVPLPVVIRSAPPILLAAPVSKPAVIPVTPEPMAVPVDEAARRASSAASPDDRKLPLAPELVPAVEAPLPHGTAASAARRVSPPVTASSHAARSLRATANLAAEVRLAAKVKPSATATLAAEATLAGTAKPPPSSKALTAKSLNSDKTSRFAHPAKAVALPGRNFGPSFNCRRAVAAVNRAICASPELSALDRQVSHTFYSATAHVDVERHKAIDRDQVDFLNQRANCNSDDCVARVYRQRLTALRQAGPGE